MSNKIYITDSQIKVKIPSGTKLLIRRCCTAVLKHEKFPHSAEVSITITDNEEIKRLNGEYRKKMSETDVLSFPMYPDGNFETVQKSADGRVALGDIVFSMEKAVEQSNTYNHPLRREVAFLIVHSMFHLLGYHHEDGGLQQVQMREREETILKQLGLPRGYNYVVEES